ncbi:Threonyl/alanyl tRNA synthetase [Myxozyma melibiosi]|uniref:Threonyl/alanyl tRNA synthetase n=1 Tax=Myxozyma melibiosi TaxID=54550 RepID=A0ABR1FAY5_9ASCO
MTSTVVGALACQVDSYLKSFDTTVVSCREVERAPAKTNGKAKGKAKKEAVEEEKPVEYELELKDTILFPEGGGQPSDSGLIKTAETSIPVLAIRRAFLTALHKVPTPLPPSTPVTLSLDWPRRFDHMQQHSGQHLISAVLDERKIPTLAWNLGEKFSYVELPRKLSDEEVAEVEDRCNDVIRQGLDITVEVPDKDLVNKEKLPDDYDAERGILRVVHIGDLDANPCCGTHLRNTREMNAIALLHQVPNKGTNSRLYFLIGDRVRKYATETHALTRRLNAKLSCQTDEIESKVARLEGLLRDALKREKMWVADVVASEAASVRASLESTQKAFVYRPDVGLDYLMTLVAELGELKEGQLLVLAAGQVKSPGALMVLGGGADKLAAKIKDVVKSVKGGGKGAKWQGKVTEWEKGEVEAVREVLESYVA